MWKKILAKGLNNLANNSLIGLMDKIYFEVERGK